VRRPLQIRKDLRDVFEKEDGLVQTTFRKLEELIGYGVSCEPEWSMLWSELQSAYPDKDNFVPAIARIVDAWCSSLAWRLEQQDAKFDEWTELLLEKLKIVCEVRLSVQVNCDFVLRRVEKQLTLI
jgi:hypothetical protein